MHFGSQVGFIKSEFFEVFPKLAPEGSQEASKRLRKAPKRPPRPDFKRFLLSFWTVFGIVLGTTSRTTRYFHHALQPYKRVWEIRSYVLCSFFFLRCFYAFQFFATFTFSDFSLGGVFRGSGIMAPGQFQHAGCCQHSVGICAGKAVG